MAHPIMHRCRISAATLTDLRSALTRLADPVCPTAILPLQQSKSGGSGSFLVRVDDGRRYWCKCLDNPQSPRVPINEQIVGRLGSYLGVAVCEVSLIRIPPELAIPSHKMWNLVKALFLNAA
jgi:hypothetical protein